MTCLKGLTMNKILLLFSLLLVTSCTTPQPITQPTVEKAISPLPEIPKPTLSKVNIGYKNNQYVIDKSNMKLFYNNYRDIIDYSLQEKTQLDYYRNMLKE